MSNKQDRKQIWITQLEELMALPPEEIDSNALRQHQKLLGQLFIHMMREAEDSSVHFGDGFSKKYRLALTSQSQFLRSLQLARNIEQEENKAAEKNSKTPNELNKTFDNSYATLDS